MANIFTTLCWFELEGKTYGPADCDITEDVTMVFHETREIALSGKFTLIQKSLPLLFDSANVRVRLKDGRHGPAVFDELFNGISGTFRVLGDLEKPGSEL